MDFAVLADQFLDAYGLLAVFAIMLLKEIGVPVPIPSDLIMLGAAARARNRKDFSGRAVRRLVRCGLPRMHCYHANAPARGGWSIRASARIKLSKK